MGSTYVVLLDSFIENVMKVVHSSVDTKNVFSYGFYHEDLHGKQERKVTIYC